MRCRSYEKKIIPECILYAIMIILVRQLVVIMPNKNVDIRSRS